jgi:hypothetical protein
MELEGNSRQCVVFRVSVERTGKKIRSDIVERLSMRGRKGKEDKRAKEQVKDSRECVVDGDSKKGRFKGEKLIEDMI